MKAYIDHYILTLRMSFPLETKGSTSTRSSSTIYIYSVYFWGRETQNVYGIKTTQLLMHVLISNAEEKCSPPLSLSFFHTRGQFGNIGSYLPEMAVNGSFYANQGDSVIVIRSIPDVLQSSRSRIEFQIK